MNDLFDTISGVLKIYLGVNITGYLVVWVFPDIEHGKIELFRLIFSGFGFFTLLLILYFKRKDYKVNKNTNEIIRKQEEENDHVWHSDYRDVKEKK